MRKQEFVSLLRQRLKGKSIYSVAEEVPYTIEVSVCEGIVKGIRGSSGNAFKVDINELSEAYNKCERPFTTTKLREFITGRVLSPALAILKALDQAMETDR